MAVQLINMIQLNMTVSSKIYLEVPLWNIQKTYLIVLWK